MQKCNTDLLNKIKKRQSVDDGRFFVDTLSIVIPVLNDDKNQLASVLNNLKSVQLTNDIHKEIIIIDDGTKDHSTQVITRFINTNQHLQIKRFQHVSQKGKTAAIKTGIRNATGELLLIQENDTLYDPIFLNDLISIIINGDANVVFGLVTNTNSKTGQNFSGKFLTFLSNKLTRFHFTRIEKSYKLFETKLLKDFKLKGSKLGFDWEVTREMSNHQAVIFREKKLP